MASSLSFRPGMLLAVSPFVDRTGPPNPLLNRAQFSGFSNHKPFLRGSLSVSKLGFKPEFLPDLDASDGVFRELFARAESFLYTIADAAVSSSDTITTTTGTSTKQNNDWLSGIADSMEAVLKVLKGGLSAVHTPYAYGFAIILLTVLVKAATFPLTRKQVESAMAMRSLQPQIKAIQKRHAGDQERIQLETARLYKLAGINPLAGCLPTLATIPVWIGLYRALSNVANEGLLTEGFFWIPSLAGPTTIAAQQKGSGISWLFPFVDGHPPLGWSATFAYLVLPVLLVVSQYISVQIMQSSQPQSNDPNMQSSQVLTKFLPLMIGYFALSVPSGLSLYWLTNNILSTAQQVWLQKLGGAKNPVEQLNNDIIKEDQIQLEKSISELSATRKVVAKQEELISDGLRPGDRFKQLKEQEERRKQEREAQRKAQEAATKAEQITNEGHEIVGSIIDKENGAGTGLGIENNEKYQYVPGQGSSNIGLVNGDLKEDQKKASSFSKSSEPLEHIEKVSVEVYTSTATIDNKASSPDTQEDM